MLITTLLASALGSSIEGLSFQHKDWELVCDNTRTCRAAGYSAESGGLSVLLTREAGAKGTLHAELAIAEVDEQAQGAPADGLITLRINGEELGTVKERTPFSQPQIAALVQAIKGTGKVVFEWSKHQEPLSGAGAYVIFLKMDEFQGRLNTSTALTKQGPLPTTSIPPALAAPVIHAGAVTSDNLSRPLTKPEQQSIGKWLKRHTDKDTCPMVDENSEGGILYPLNQKRALVQLPCWLAAYNDGSAFIVLDTNLDTASATLISTDANGYGMGELSASHKGRGIGDCFSFESWVWDGKNFVQSEQSTTGSCRMIALGGTWHLPTLTSKVVKAQ
ncbi:DUF1176 domain-containing protein [Aeromonas dhakensis]|uniref:DUF1176 domain-containing protein n=1 Tax=Aeromonas dhakensis TaxID=196024 RepID=UPI0021B4B64C|nr:DUF1176 domain-containing protein [Aeromonas dhakensis]UXB11558.1 DUF1176 domain-containing protein [Aeromonas dhakensis]